MRLPLRSTQLQPLFSPIHSSPRRQFGNGYHFSQRIVTHQQHIRSFYLPPWKLLKGKTVLVTGASRGLGMAIAKRFGVLGCKLILVGRNEMRLNSLTESIRKLRNEQENGSREICEENGGNGMSESFVEAEIEDSEIEDIGYMVGDVGDLEGFWRKNFDRRGPRVDILINAAGITHASPLITTSASLIEEVLRTNLLGTTWGCKVIAPGMLRRRDGCIINISSLLGMKGGRGSAAYAASKAGILGLTRALAAEMGPSGIRVNALVPGYIETEMTKAMSPAARTEAEKAIPLKRFGTVHEIADAAVFLATNQYANNCVLNLDGGLSAV